MTVRTDKIQALTGSAPLTLPKALPATKKNVKVDTSGNITAPSTSVNFSSLGTASETGWVLLAVKDQQTFTTNFQISIDDASGYSGSDIYQYRLEWSLVSSRNGNSNHFVLSPMNGSTNISQTMSGMASGWSKVDVSWTGGVNSRNSTGTYGSEHFLCNTATAVAGVNAMTNFDAMFSNPIPWSDSSAGETASYKGGAWGTTDYYNGASNRMIPPVLEQVNVNRWNNSYNMSSSGGYNVCFAMAGVIKKGSVNNSSFADGFTFSTTNGWDGNNSAYQLAGQVNMYGIPKTG
tara:strand:+ start:2512 stop:3384 length:873 start_codon:yes stop_codon:yes gene_type:complete